MSRWKPDAQSRLQQAALDIFSERGYEQTTVADIARRAELTERTFFRHYVDKREVLFSGPAPLDEFLVRAIASQPDDVTPVDAIVAALSAAGVDLFTPERRDFIVQRQAVIAANAPLRERELSKLASLTVAIAGALRRRRVEEPAASLAAELGIVIFRVAFDRWVADDQQQALALFVGEALAEIRVLAA